MLQSDNFRFKTEVRWWISKLTALSDWASLITPVYTLELPLFNLKFQKTDYFWFKPEVRGWTKISLLQAKSQGSITLVGIFKSATIDFLLA